MLLLRLLVGSHLYGTAHEESDFDWYEVHDTAPTRRGGASQTISGDQDVLRIGLSAFMRQADSGVPQALEVMFAPADWPEVDVIRDMRVRWFPDTARAANTYERTIKSFETLKVTEKRLTHAKRLAYNRDELIRTGRFDPTDTTWRTHVP